MSKKIIAVLLTLTMLAGCGSVLAENTKYERVYVVTGADGTVKSLTDSVRLENADGLTEITDRSALKEIQNVSGEETFVQEGETLVWKADGKDIVYQGTSDKAPAVVPVVSLMLDGEEVTAEELKNRTGEAVLTVSYRMNEKTSLIAVSMMALPETGVTELKMENAKLVSEMGRQIVVGWAVPGADEALNLPKSFTVSFHADHADLEWMMTLCTAEPIDRICKGMDEKINVDLHQELEQLTKLLTALKNGTEIPEITGKCAETAVRISTLNNGLTQLDDGAQKLSEGAVQVSEGAAQLKTGLAALKENNGKLNEGARQIFGAVLDTANTQLAASGLAEAGIVIPTLTAENYAEVLDMAIKALDPETLKAAAYPQVEAVVRPKVMQKEAAIREGVTQAVQAKVLENVLEAAGVIMTAEQYEAAVKAEKIPADQAKQVNAAVEAQMKTEEVQAQIEKAVQEKIEELVKENTEKAMAEDKTVAAKLEKAAEARESLKALKDQLDQVNTFVTGLNTYTEGVAQAADGADQLAAGAAELSTGAANLQENGTAAMKAGILAAEKDAASALLPYAEKDFPDALRIFEETRDQAGNAGYDLRSDDMKTVTAYIIRTDLQK